MTGVALTAAEREALADWRALVAADCRKAMPTKGAMQEALGRAVDLIDRLARPAPASAATTTEMVEHAPTMKEHVMSDDAKKAEGLIEKFKVERLTPSSRGIDHDGCRYFVLDPQHDPGARFALRAYKVWAEKHGFGPLAADLDSWLDGLDD